MSSKKKNKKGQREQGDTREELLLEVDAPEEAGEAEDEATREFEALEDTGRIRVNDRRSKGVGDGSGSEDGSRIVVSGGKRRSRVMDIRASRKRQKDRRRLQTLMVVLIIILFAEIAYMLKDHWVPRLEALMDQRHETVVNDGHNQSGNFPLTYSEGAVKAMGHIGNNLVTVDKNQVRLYTESGEEANSFSHSFADPVLRTAEKRMMIYDKGGAYIKVMNAGKEIFQKTFQNRIILAEIADNNNIAVVTSSDKYPGIMTVYDPNGRELFKWSSSQRILSMSFADGGDSIVVATFGAKGGELYSVVRHFGLDSERELMKSETLPTLAIDIGYTAYGEYWVVGDTAFYRLGEDGKAYLEYKYPGDLSCYALDDQCAALAFAGRTRKTTRLVMMRADSDGGDPDHDIYLEDGSPAALEAVGDRLILLRSGSVDCYGLDGELVATAPLESEHSRMEYFDGSIYFLDFKEINKITFTT